MAETQSFDLAALESALTELGRRSYEGGRTVEIAVYGGSALLLTLNRQANTRNVDAVFEKDKDFVKKLAADMAAPAKSALQAARTRWPLWRSFIRTI